MLQSSDKKKIENYIQKIIDGLSKDAQKSIASGMNDKQVVERITRATVNRLTPESKMIMSGVYNMMMNETLSEEQFQDAENKAAFYQMNILKELDNKFSFEVLEKISYSENRDDINRYITNADIVAIVKLLLKKIFELISFNIKHCSKKKDIEQVISQYLTNVQKSLLDWVESIEVYYDKRVEELKKGINA